MRWTRRRAHEEQAADERLAAASREVELSRRRLADAHKHVVQPLRDYADRNHFADMIRDSLIEGR
jgi:hypothetical protein